MAMTFFRWLFAIAILTPFAWPHLRRDWPIIRAHWKTMFVLGAIGVGTHNGLAYLGLNFTTATNGVILNSFIPIMIITISLIFLREKLTPLQVLGVLVSLTGVLTVLSRGSIDTLLGFRLNIGDLFIIGSMAMWAVYDQAALAAGRHQHAVVPAGRSGDRRPVRRPAVGVGMASGDSSCGVDELGWQLFAVRPFIGASRSAYSEPMRWWCRSRFSSGAGPSGRRGVRRPRLAVPGGAPAAIPCGRNRAHTCWHLGDEPLWCQAHRGGRGGGGGNGLGEKPEARMEDNIGNPQRVAFQQRIVELKMEHRDRHCNRPARRRLRHDELQLQRLKRRKLLLKDQIARLGRSTPTFWPRIAPGA
jgi:uncharacterized membrane protein